VQNKKKNEQQMKKIFTFLYHNYVIFAGSSANQNLPSVCTKNGEKSKQASNNNECS
jgi:hypothetical protein